VLHQVAKGVAGNYHLGESQHLHALVSSFFHGFNNISNVKINIGDTKQRDCSANAEEPKILV
jgi:hypothetical protein